MLKENKSLHFHHRRRYSSLYLYWVMRDVLLSKGRYKVDWHVVTLAAKMSNSWRIPCKISPWSLVASATFLSDGWLIHPSFIWNDAAGNHMCPCRQSRGGTINIKAMGRAEGESRVTRCVSVAQEQLLIGALNLWPGNLTLWGVLIWCCSQCSGEFTTLFTYNSVYSSHWSLSTISRGNVHEDYFQDWLIGNLLLKQF